MRLVQDYELHAKECRKMAAEAAVTQRLTIIQMAEAWTRLAAERRKLIEKGKADAQHHGEPQT